MKLCNLLNEWLYIYNKRRIKMTTFTRYKNIINSNILNSKLINMDISIITKKDIQSYVNILLNKKTNKNKILKPSTINNVIKLLHSIFKYAVMCSYIDNNPCSNIKMVKVSKDNIIFHCFLIEEQRLIEKYCYDNFNSYTQAILLALYTGIRLGEVTALIWDNIDLSNDIIYIKQNLLYGPDYNNKNILYLSNPKTKSSIREIPISNIVKNLLLNMKSYSLSNYLFTDSKGNNINPQYLSKVFSNITKKLNINRLSFHSLRHTFATRALESGADPKTLSLILGHSSVGITLKTYGHSTNFHKHEAINNIKKEVIDLWK